MLGRATKTEAPPAATPASTEAQVPLFDGLGTHTRAIAAANPEAQRYFDQGLNFLFGFNHDEAIRAFRKAAEVAPDAPMPWWGVAVAYGPHINFPIVPPDKAAAAWEALGKARERAPKGSEVEQGLIEALSKRYASPQPEDRKPLDEAYAAAMGDVAARFPQDDDVAALFAESMMDLRPWDLWTPDGKQQPGTDEILRTLETSLARSPSIPLALHLYIHSIEMSPEPHKADQAATRCATSVPALGHLVHMPSHIDVRTGRWQQAIEANVRAEKADVAYRERVPKQNFYRVYMAHNHHMRTFACMMLGRSAEAIQTIDTMVARSRPTGPRRTPSSWTASWPCPGKCACASGSGRSCWRCRPAGDFPHRAVAPARGAWDRVRGHRQEGRRAGRAEGVRAGAGHRGRGRHLRQTTPGGASSRCRRTCWRGSCPSRKGITRRDWPSCARRSRRRTRSATTSHRTGSLPCGHALGAALIEDKKYAEAEKVYRADLKKLPGNGWSLFGLGHSPGAPGKDRGGGQGRGTVQGSLVHLRRDAARLLLLPAGGVGPLVILTSPRQVIMMSR
jgi:tetratricopeptide (TPR) repeat protein